MAVVTCDAYKTIGDTWTGKDEWVTLTYDFALDGGGNADTHRLAAVTGKILVKEAIVHVETLCGSAGAATMVIGAETADPDAFMDVTSGAVANLADDFTLRETTGQLLVIDGASATDYITADIETADFNAGKVNVYLRYMTVV